MTELTGWFVKAEAEVSFSLSELVFGVPSPSQLVAVSGTSAGEVNDCWAFPRRLFLAVTELTDRFMEAEAEASSSLSEQVFGVTSPSQLVAVSGTSASEVSDCRAFPRRLFLAVTEITVRFMEVEAEVSFSLSEQVVGVPSLSQLVAVSATSTGEVNDCWPFPKRFFLTVATLGGCIVEVGVSCSLSKQVVEVPCPSELVAVSATLYASLFDMCGSVASLPS